MGKSTNFDWAIFNSYVKLPDPIWMNKNDLIVTSLEWCLVTLSKGTTQQIADYFRYFQVRALLQFSQLESRKNGSYHPRWEIIWTSNQYQ